MSSSNDEKKISPPSVVSIVFGVLADWNIIVLNYLSYVLILPSGNACFARVEKAKRFQSPKSLSDGTMKGCRIKMKRNMCPKRVLAARTIPLKDMPFALLIRSFATLENVMQHCATSAVTLSKISSCGVSSLPPSYH